jgi:uncharacterized protein
MLNPKNHTPALQLHHIPFICRRISVIVESMFKKFSRRTFLKLSLAGTVLAPPLGLAYARYIEPAWVDVESVPLWLPRLHPAFDGYRVAHISDIHLDSWLGIDRLREIIQTINSLQVDLVVMTGDFVTSTLSAYYEQYAESLRQFIAYDGVMAVLGNHDHWMNAAYVRRLLADGGVRNVSNNVHSIQRGDAQLHIAGVDDVWEQQDRLDIVLDKLPDEGAAILLAHEPDYADESAAVNRFDLQLSGHTHGGQVYLPFFGAPILPMLGFKYPRGLYRVGTMYQYTNRGIGMIAPTVRFNCRPEITLLTLHVG